MTTSSERSASYDPVPYDSAPETQKHIDRVGDFLSAATLNLVRRASKHDQSKLEEPEKEAFDRMTPILATLTYGTEEYKASVRELGPALQHHFAANDHHPEHYPGGVPEMSAMAIIEMVCDWRAASERTKQRSDGDEYLKRSFAEGLDYNQKRFGYGDEVASIIRATARELGLIE